MDIKWTFFISSTLEDLRAERQAVANQILKMEEIPIGMEQFGAIDKSSWENIEKFIDSADYYILIIAGKYGSIGDPPDDISFTEREYRYARSKGIPVIAVLHGDPESLPSKLSEQSLAKKQKLEAFRAEVKRAMLVAFYTNPAELIGEVAAAIAKAKSRFPRPGWVRNDGYPGDSQSEVLRLQAELSQARAELQSLMVEREVRQNNLAEREVDGHRYLNARVKLVTKTKIDIVTTNEFKERIISIPMSWKRVFYLIAAELYDRSRTSYFLDDVIASGLAKILDDQSDASAFKVAKKSVTEIQFVLQSLELIQDSTFGGWSLTSVGNKLYVDWEASRILPKPYSKEWHDLDDDDAD